jgi:hypothetical protein
VQKLFSRLLASKLVLLAVLSAAPGSTFHVAPDGDDSAGGTKEAPWKTLQRAAIAVRAGDSVIVRAGTYDGFVLGWENPQSGTETQRITFKAEPGAVIDSRGKTPDGIDLEGCSYVTIDGFEVRNVSGKIARAGIRAGGRSEGVIIRNNKVDGCGKWGIFTSFASRVLIENNVTSHSRTQHGIYVSNSSTEPVIRGNVSYGNRGSGIQLNGDASQGGSGVITDARIEKNIIHDNGNGGGSGINCDGVQRSVIQNNLLYGNQCSGISLFREDGAAGSTDNKVINNTIVQASRARWCVNIKGRSSGNAVLNNILYGPDRGRGSLTIAADSLPGLTSDYNAVVDRFSSDDGGTLVPLASWRMSTGQDQHSFVAEKGVLFANPAAGDYHLAANGPAVDAGTQWFAPATDLEGNRRPEGKAWDIGAYELVPASRSGK